MEQEKTIPVVRILEREGNNMSKYFKNVKSYNELKSTYKELLKANHPDNGGDLAKMQEINAEYDVMFAIWKNRKEAETGETVTETANSTRIKFYTDLGWEGSNHDWNRSLKEVAKIVRTYVKEKYPTYKFSVRTSYASMCQELHVELKESPIEVYKPFEELTSDDFSEIGKRLFMWDYDIENRLNFLNASAEEKKKVIEESKSKYAYILNDITKSVIEDVDGFVKSYNYEDCDSMIDYFHVDFYYFGCCQDNGKDIKVVPKTARIKAPATTPTVKKDAAAPDQIETSCEAFTVTESEHTKTHEKIFLVKCLQTLSRDAYINLNKQMRDIGGYYSKFTHSFIFKNDPTEALKGVKIA